MFSSYLVIQTMHDKNFTQIEKAIRLLNVMSYQTFGKITVPSSSTYTWSKKYYASSLSPSTERRALLISPKNIPCSYVMYLNIFTQSNCNRNWLHNY